MIQLRSMLCHCPHCNAETFLEPDVNSQKCIDCENTIQKPMVLKVDQYRIPLFEGQRIYNIQLPIDGSLNAVVGEVVKTCENCINCMYEEAGDMYCDEHKDFVYVYDEFCPTESYMWCGGKKFIER